VIAFERRRGEFEITTDISRVDVDAVHAYLTRSYWAEGIPRAIVAKSIASSLCFSLFEGVRQIGFARVVTDCATFAYLCDVYVLEEYRGRGLGKWLMRELLTHPDLQGVRRFMLVTRDAHGLYEPLGFRSPENPARYMEIVKRDIYKTGGG
jgi:GNAT superfamily N-acetyltransferase